MSDELSSMQTDLVITSALASYSIDVHFQSIGLSESCSVYPQLCGSYFLSLFLSNFNTYTLHLLI